MSKHRNVITLVQEPYINNKKTLANCPSRYDIFPADRTGRKRVAIFSSRHLKLTEINELCTQSLVAVGGIIEDQKFIFASIYMHYDKEIISQEVIDLITYAKKNAFQLIIGADSNATVVYGDLYQKTNVNVEKTWNSGFYKKE